METVVMCASIITAIILCFVGIIKLPFKKFKENHPKWYRTVFYSVSLVLAVVGPIISQLYILNGSLYSMEFLVLIVSTIAGVFGLYTTYEGLGLKQLVKIIVEKVGELFNKYSESRLAKIVKQEGIDKLNDIAKKLAEDEAKKAAEAESAKMQTAEDKPEVQSK